MAQHRLGHIRIRDDAEGMVDEMRSAGQVRYLRSRKDVDLAIGDYADHRARDMRDTCGLTQRSYKPHSETRDVVCVKYWIDVFMNIPWTKTLRNAW